MVNLIKDSERGDLMAFDTIDVPFYVKRIFVVNNVNPHEIRGNHSHKSCLQLLICTNGSIDLHYTDGIHNYIVKLYKGDSYLIEPLVWSKQIYNEYKSELMVLCSHEYDKNDYITDFEDFKKLVNEN